MIIVECYNLRNIDTNIILYALCIADFVEICSFVIFSYIPFPNLNNCMHYMYLDCLYNGISVMII